MALRTPSRHFPGYELSFGTSFTKVGRLGAMNNCVTQTDIHYVNLYVDVYFNAPRSTVNFVLWN